MSLVYSLSFLTSSLLIFPSGFKAYGVGLYIDKASAARIVGCTEIPQDALQKIVNIHFVHFIIHFIIF